MEFISEACPGLSIDTEGVQQGGAPCPGEESSSVKRQRKKKGKEREEIAWNDEILACILSFTNIKILKY